MMTPKALAALRRDMTLAKHHLAFLERNAALDPAEPRWGRVRATPAMIAEAQAEVARLEGWLAEETPQLPLL